MHCGLIWLIYHLFLLLIYSGLTSQMQNSAEKQVVQVSPQSLSYFWDGIRHSSHIFTIIMKSDFKKLCGVLCCSRVGWYIHSYWLNYWPKSRCCPSPGSQEPKSQRQALTFVVSKDAKPIVFIISISSSVFPSRSSSGKDNTTKR